MSDESPIDDTTGGLDRRSLIKRGAIVGGALVWTTPVVQALASPAFGATPSNPGGGGGGGATCIKGTVLAFKNDRGMNMSTTGTLAPDTNGPCEDAGADVVSAVTQDTSIVSVVYIDGPLPGPGLTIARITLAPGYVLTSVRTKTANQPTDGNPCPASILNPTPVGVAPNGGNIYEVQGLDGGRPDNQRDISHVTGVIRCA